MYIGVNGTSRKVTKAYIGVNGKSREVNTGYIGVNNQSRLFYKASNINWTECAISDTSIVENAKIIDIGFVSGYYGIYSFNESQKYGLTFRAQDGITFTPTINSDSNRHINTKNLASNTNAIIYSGRGIGDTGIFPPSSYNIVMRTVNGSSWLSDRTPITQYGYGWAYEANNGFYILPYDSSNNVLRLSIDGNAWTQTPLPSASNCVGISYAKKLINGNDSWIILNDGIGKQGVFESDNGGLFNEIGLTMEYDGWCGIVGGNKMHIGIRYNSTGNEPELIKIIHDTLGQPIPTYNFERISNNSTTSYFNSITFGNGKFMILDSNYTNESIISKNRLLVSNGIDGEILEWKELPLPDIDKTGNIMWNKIRFINNRLYLFGQSKDGSTPYMYFFEDV